ncbi:MAG TPA: assimilatory sulfite reductase (NADPH) flavoprotein subunit [Prolixibacteraceae bacterium]|jgi:sulfite reductase (NADPH) flavoprotein alpha-component|nr:assimilatory sulfite reductase (NADPH) flavoprotein subunit [Prolixibacteraceae bacterium]
MTIQLSPLNEKQIKALEMLTNGLQKEQLLWINGYFQGLLASSSIQVSDAVIQPKSHQQLTILYGTHTGRSKTIAGKLSEKLTHQGVEVKAIALDEYKTRLLTSETHVVFIVSTHGEGEPPAMAEDFHAFITGKRSPALPELNYSVVALGDKSYKLFCQTGIDIDIALIKSGAKTILPILKLDVDFEEDVEHWMNQFTNTFTDIQVPAHLNGKAIDGIVKVQEYSKKNPFKATVLDKVKITGRDSDKEVYHVELSLEGSGITYEPGDSVGILSSNPPSLVEAILKNKGFDGSEIVTIKEGEFSIREILSTYMEITVLNREVIQLYFEKSQHSKLQEILENEDQLDHYLYGHDVLDLLEEFPFEMTPQGLASVLRRFPARLYSISSSQAAVGDEVHITVSRVRYSNKGRQRSGACSNYLAEQIEVDSLVPMFIEKNPAFKLPEDDQTPVILVGAGTGVAPYRAFLQHREANNQKGNTWLFFGERRFHSDFLYQIEWQKLLKNGFLEKIDVAFSRDQDEKIYVQHRLLQKQQEIFAWLEKGASIYLCGDMKQMARDVQNALLQIIETQGGMSVEKALEYLKKLKKEKRFQTDVY